ncbi:hypothetical protein DFH94DRAFT_343061 [Russula ochroleuca]|uniref:Secreted protein n=1 Tax=Russula ochroleuca TaxID=152965 RepID=A0A9P5ML30_9AGAM|nr:hypothetical protein DFH94DRAFT_343061 [Russula ochroleuca]
MRMLEIRTNHVTLLCCSLITSAIYAYKPQPQPQTSTEVWLPNRPLLLGGQGGGSARDSESGRGNASKSLSAQIARDRSEAVSNSQLLFDFFCL